MTKQTTTERSSPLTGGLIAVSKARKERLGNITMPTLWTWVDRGILPQPIRPTGGTKGRLYWRVNELEEALAKINAV